MFIFWKLQYSYNSVNPLQPNAHADDDYKHWTKCNEQFPENSEKQVGYEGGFDLEEVNPHMMLSVCVLGGGGGCFPWGFVPTVEASSWALQQCCG